MDQPTVATPYIRHLLAAAQELGADISRALRHVRISPEQLEDPDARVALPSHHLLWRQLSSELGRENLGFAAGRRFRPSDEEQGPIAVALGIGREGGADAAELREHQGRPAFLSGAQLTADALPDPLDSGMLSGGLELSELVRLRDGDEGELDARRLAAPVGEGGDIQGDRVARRGERREGPLGAPRHERVPLPVVDQEAPFEPWISRTCEAT